MFFLRPALAFAARATSTCFFWVGRMCGRSGKEKNTRKNVTGEKVRGTKKQTRKVRYGKEKRSDARFFCVFLCANVYFSVRCCVRQLLRDEKLTNCWVFWFQIQIAYEVLPPTRSFCCISRQKRVELRGNVEDTHAFDGAGSRRR